MKQPLVEELEFSCGHPDQASWIAWGREADAKKTIRTLLRERSGGADSAIMALR